MKNQPYESDNFVSEMQSVWTNLKPLYDQLHAYVRYKLHKHYVRILALMQDGTYVQTYLSD